MSVDMQPLIWIIKQRKDDDWPKKNFGASLIYSNDEKSKQYFLIGGNHDAYEVEKKNYELNRKLIEGINYELNKKLIEGINSNSDLKSIFEPEIENCDLKQTESFIKAEKKKREYVKEKLKNYNSQAKIDLFIYDVKKDDTCSWKKTSTHGKIPKPRAFHQCIYIKPFIFLFGGVELGPKGDNVSNDDLYVLDTTIEVKSDSQSYIWSQIISNPYPFNRTNFKWIQIENTAYLYGGCSSPFEKYYDDMWKFTFTDELRKKIKESSNNKVYLNDLWEKLYPTGQSPGKVKAYAMEYCNGFLYLFGGINHKKVINNDLYRYDISANNWEKVSTTGSPPSKRCYHEMALINDNTLLVFGGWAKTLDNHEEFYNDVYLLNIEGFIWVTPVIGGIPPTSRIGFCFCKNRDKNDIMILGGSIQEKDPEERNYIKIFCIAENDKNSNAYWTVRSIDYKEENDEKFILDAEKMVYEYKAKISKLELETKEKQNQIQDLKREIESVSADEKNNIDIELLKAGLVEPQDYKKRMNDLSAKKQKALDEKKADEEIIDLKLKLKKIMEKKNSITMAFFNETLNTFIYYYDSMKKIIEGKDKQPSNIEEEINNKFPAREKELIHKNFKSNLNELKKKMERIKNEEDTCLQEIKDSDYFKNSKIEKIFKKEIDTYNISNDQDK